MAAFDERRREMHAAGDGLGGGTPVRFRDLAPLERDLICNGCGPKGGKVPVPEFMFTASCDHHDFNYWIGHTERDREKADWQFYLALREDAKRAPWYSRWWHRMMAWTYYLAVRAFGESSFHYGPRPRTREDLDRELKDLL